MPLDEETYVESFRPHLMDVVYQWCSGASFRQILQTTEIFEGTVKPYLFWKSSLPPVYEVLLIGGRLATPLVDFKLRKPILGSIIRALRRLEELLREMIGAAKSIGNTELEQKFETARNQLKRDIVFAASLYL